MKSLFIALFTILSIVSTNAVASSESPMSVDGATYVTSEQAKQLFEEGVVFIDVRKPSDWDAGRVPSAYHLDLKSNFSEASLSDVIKKSEKIVIYCNGASCMRSSKASDKAVSWGFTNVHYYRDGFPAWQGAGYPVE